MHVLRTAEVTSKTRPPIATHTPLSPSSSPSPSSSLSPLVLLLPPLPPPPSPLAASAFRSACNLALTSTSMRALTCRGAEAQRCRGAEVQRCRGAEVQRCGRGNAGGAVGGGVHVGGLTSASVGFAPALMGVELRRRTLYGRHVRGMWDCASTSASASPLPPLAKRRDRTPSSR